MGGKVGWAGLFKDSSIRWRTFLACAIMIFQQLTGVNVFLGYASTIFAGIGITNPLEFNALFNLAQVVGIFVGIALIDWGSWLGGRRIAFLVSALLMGPPMLVASASYGFDWPGLIVMVMVCIYGFGFQVAWGPVPWVYTSEIFTTTERDTANGLAVALEYGANALIVYVTPYLIEWSLTYTLGIFGVVNLLIAAFVAIFVTETKGVPVEMIPELFGSHSLAGSAADKASGNTAVNA